MKASLEATVGPVVSARRHELSEADVVNLIHNSRVRAPAGLHRRVKALFMQAQSPGTANQRFAARGHGSRG